MLVLSHSSELGGAELSMLDLFDDWYKKGLIDPIFIVKGPVKNMGPELRKRKWPYHPVVYSAWSRRVPLDRADDIFRNAVYDTRAILEIEQIIQDVNPDIVMTNTIVAPWAAIAANFQGLPHVWFVREYGDLDHGHIMELGTKETFEDISYFSDMVVTNSLTLRSHLEAYIEKKKLATIYTPFDLEALHEKSLVKIASPFKRKDSLKLVITGRIAPSKGQATAAETVGSLVQQGHDVELCVIGANFLSSDIDTLNEMIRKYDIADRVHLVGQQKNPYAYVRLADVGIMASQKEAFGRTTFEYLALGKPVVGANAGATPEMVIDGETGFLYEHGNSKNMEMQILKYLKNPETITAHSKAALAKTKYMMNGQHNADNLFEKIEKIVEAPSASLRGPRMPHYVHKLLEYPGVGHKHMTTGTKGSIKRQIYIRMRQKAKVVIVKADKIINKPGKRRY